MVQVQVSGNNGGAAAVGVDVAEAKIEEEIQVNWRAPTKEYSGYIPCIA
jgi:hypothetical protein